MITPVVQINATFFTSITFKFNFSNNFMTVYFQSVMRENISVSISIEDIRSQWISPDQINQYILVDSYCGLGGQCIAWRNIILFRPNREGS